MAEISPEREKRPVRLNVVYPPPPCSVENISFVKFSHLASQVMMDVGVLDDQGLIKVLNQKDAETASVDAHVLHRYAMSVETLGLLQRNLSEIVSKMIKGGVLKPEESEETKSDG